MEYSELLDSVCRHVEQQGASCTVTCGKPASEKVVATAEARMKVQLPAELRDFYRKVGNGYVMFWQADPLDDEKPSGGLEVPPLSTLARMYHGWRTMALYSPEQAEEYGFPYTSDPELAKRTAARQWNWLPIIEEGNGDIICMDLSVPGGPVIFHKHDWLDGGTGDDGHLLAPNWREFLMGWGSVCFQFPEDLYWPSCFRPGGGVAWDGDRFRDPFRMAGRAES